MTRDIKLRHLRVAAMCVIADELDGVASVDMSDNASLPSFTFDDEGDELQRMLLVHAGGGVVAGAFGCKQLLPPSVVPVFDAYFSGAESEDQRLAAVKELCDTAQGILTRRWKQLIRLADELQTHQDQRGLRRLPWARIASVLHPGQD